MARFGLRRVFPSRRVRIYRPSFPTRAYDHSNMTWAEVLKLRLPHLILNVACAFCVFVLVTVLALNLSPSYAQVAGIGKISSWRLHHTPSSSPSHHQRSDYIYTLYPAGICVQPITSSPTPLLSTPALSSFSIRTLAARAFKLNAIAPRAIDHDSRHVVTSAACLPPIVLNASRIAWRYRLPTPYSLDEYAPTEAILKQRPYSMVGPVDTYPAFVGYVLAIIFESAPLVYFLRQRRNSHWRLRYGRSTRHRNDDSMISGVVGYSEDPDDGLHASNYASTGPLLGSGNLYSNKQMQTHELQLHAFTTVCALIAMTAIILASVYLTLLRESIAWSLERGAPDVDGVWKEDVGLAFTWSAAACLILIALGMVTRALLVLLVRRDWISWRLLEGWL